MSMDPDNVNTAALSEPLLDHFDDTAFEDEESHDNDNTCVPRQVTSILSIYTEQYGSCRNITIGLALLTFFGTIIGLAMPKNPALLTPWYRSLSSVIGYTYFMCWSVSFYPQIVTNFQTKSVNGLSTDAAVISVLIDACYMIYTATFYWNRGIREEYRTRHHGSGSNNVDVESNDVAFCIHAEVLDLVALGQILYYGGCKRNPISYMTRATVGAVLLLCGVYASCRSMELSGFLWIDFLYILSYIKVSLSFMTYIPQILLNRARQSTVGWNIWNVYLDFAGGLLSMMQLVADSVDMGDVTGITGNWAKFLLGFMSLFFDSIFFLQHFFLYSEDRKEEEEEEIDEESIGDSPHLATTCVFLTKHETE